MKKRNKTKAYVYAVIVALVYSIVLSVIVGLLVNGGLEIKIVPEIGFMNIALLLLPLLFIVILISILLFIMSIEKLLK
jgi:hypothetical protein